MFDILPTIVRWRTEGLTVALAALVDVEQSAPRAVGAAVAVNERGEVAGSISGGCVESDVVEALTACIAGAPARTITFGIGEDAAHEHGLTCGGTLHVLVRALDSCDDEGFARVLTAVESERPAFLATRLDAPHTGAMLAICDDESFGSLGAKRLESALRMESYAAIETPYAMIRTFGADGEPLRTDARIFVQSFAPKPDMFVFGAVDFSRAMATVGAFLGYRVSVIDARPVFATEKRIPDADRVVVAWPDEFLQAAVVRPSTVLIVLTHDLKFDVPLLRVALASEAGYIGVMGSRNTHATRIAALRDVGVGETELRRLHAPVGLDIGAQTPEETAISIAAELIAARNGRHGGSLREGTASLHGPIVLRSTTEALRTA